MSTPHLAIGGALAVAIVAEGLVLVDVVLCLLKPKGAWSTRRRADLTTGTKGGDFVASLRLVALLLALGVTGWGSYRAARDEAAWASRDDLAMAVLLTTGAVVGGAAFFLVFGRAAERDSGGLVAVLKERGGWPIWILWLALIPLTGATCYAWASVLTRGRDAAYRHLGRAAASLLFVGFVAAGTSAHPNSPYGAQWSRCWLATYVSLASGLLLVGYAMLIVALTSGDPDAALRPALWA